MAPVRIVPKVDVLVVSTVEPAPGDPEAPAGVEAAAVEPPLEEQAAEIAATRTRPLRTRFRVIRISAR